MKKNLWALLLMLGMICIAAPAQAYVIGWWGKRGSQELGTGATITWSLRPTDMTPCNRFAPLCAGHADTVSHLQDFMPANYMDAIYAGFDAWSAVANLTFIQVPDSGNVYSGGGDIRIGAHRMPYYIWAYASLPVRDIYFNNALDWEVSFSLDSLDVFQVFTHEVGHVLGLDHSNVADSVMNYYPEDVGLRPDDIAAVQYLYGPRVVTQVPEPGILTLLGAGLLAIVARRKAVA